MYFKILNNEKKTLSCFHMIKFSYEDKINLNIFDKKCSSIYYSE